MGRIGSEWFVCLAEAPRLATWLRCIGVHLIPDAAFESYRTREGLCLKLCTSAKTRLPEKRSVGDIHGLRSADHPVVYAQPQLKLLESGPAGDELDTVIAAEMLDHMLAGHETSGITLTYFICKLSREPLVLKRLREELSAPRDPDQVWFNPAAIDCLGYLDAVLMEALSPYPATPGPFPRVVPAKELGLASLPTFLPARPLVPRPTVCIGIRMCFPSQRSEYRRDG